MTHDANPLVNVVTLQTPFWWTGRDDSRPTGDKPTKGDYIYNGNQAYRVLDARPDGAGWLLDCEEVRTWMGDNSDYRVFDWAWRTKVRA